MYKAIQSAAPFSQGKLIYLFETQRQWMFNQLNLKNSKGIDSSWTSNFVNAPTKTTTYNIAESYGYLRNITAQQFAAGEYSNKDILIFDQVPLDIGPLAGVISETALVPNSHIIFRSINQKIPSIYIPNAEKDPSISPYLGKLIRFTTLADGKFGMEIANLRDAEQYFTSRVPILPAPRSDLTNQEIFRFGEGDPHKDLVVAYGAKGTNFALLNNTLVKAETDRQNFGSSMLLPFSFYRDHLAQKLESKVCAKSRSKCSENGFSCDVLAEQCQAQAGRISLNYFVNSLTSSSSELLADSDKRKNTLAYIRYLIAKSPLPVPLETKLISELHAGFAASTRIRFRSSSNAEDLPGLSGAGLYDSHSGCLGDIDNSEPGRSACMTAFEYGRVYRRIEELRAINHPQSSKLIEDLLGALTDKDEPKDALRKVYASLWTERAFLYRDYYRIPHHLIFMGVLIMPSFADESANGVAVVEKKGEVWELSIVVQAEEISVTNPEFPGAIADNLRTILNRDGSFNKPIVYYSHSNQKQGPVLSEAQVLDLSRQLQTLQITFEELMGVKYRRLDIEFKANAQGIIEIKQARPL